jgi:hypothetical protein
MDFSESSAAQEDSPRIDAEGILAVARMSKLPLAPEVAAARAEQLESFLAFADGWEDLGLAFSFNDGAFDYAPSLAQFRPEWDRPTRLNKQRADPPGDPASEGAPGDRR